MHFLYQEKIFFIIENRSVTSRMLRQSQQLTARNFSFLQIFRTFSDTRLHPKPICCRRIFFTSITKTSKLPQDSLRHVLKNWSEETNWRLYSLQLVSAVFFAMHISRSRFMLRRTPERNKAVKNFSSLLSSTSEVWSGQHQESTSHCCCAINFVFFRERWDWVIWLLG